MQSATSALALALMLAATSPGQNTWIVDANGGPGTNFRDLQPAVTTAAPGDRILVRAGSYNTVGVTKPLSILGEPGAVVAGGFVFGLTIQGIPAGATLAVRGLQITTVSLGMAVTVADCAGTVLLENLTFSTRLHGSAFADLRLVQCTTGPIDVQNATIALEDCDVSSPNIRSTTGSLLATDSQVVISRCHIQGSPGIVNYPGGPAITLSRSLAVILGDGSGALAAGPSTVPTPAIDGTGVLLRDPNAVILPNLGAPPVAATIAATVLRMPSVSATGSAIGGTVQVDLFAAPADSYFLFVGSLAPPTFIPGVVGALWVRDAVVVLNGIVGASQRVNLAVPVPPVSALIGLSFCWQGLTIAAQGPAGLSNPASYVHHP